MMLQSLQAGSGHEWIATVGWVMQRELQRNGQCMVEVTLVTKFMCDFV